MAGKGTGFKVTNPTDRDIILNRFEGGDTYVVPAGKSITTDNQRAALTLAEAGAKLDQQTYEAAVNAEARDEAEGRVESGVADRIDRAQRRDRIGAGEPTVVNPSPVAPVGVQEEAGVPVVPSDEAVTDPHPSAPVPDELVDGDPVPAADPFEPAVEEERLKGAALDEALEGLSLAKTGTAEDKRARLAEARAAIAAQDAGA